VDVLRLRLGDPEWTAKLGPYWASLPALGILQSKEAWSANYLDVMQDPGLARPRRPQLGPSWQIRTKKLSASRMAGVLQEPHRAELRTGTCTCTCKVSDRQALGITLALYDLHGLSDSTVDL
jgi:hypothetical protein